MTVLRFGILAAMMFASVPALAQFMVEPPKRTTTGAILFGNAANGFADAMAGIGEMYAAKADLSVEIEQARQSFWSQIDNPQGYDQRYETYTSLLMAKDYAYMSFMLGEGTMSQFSALMAGIGGDIDGGIPEEAAFDFENWVKAIRGSMGVYDSDFLLVSPQAIAEAFRDPRVLEAYRKYQLDRDRVEFRNAGYEEYFDQLVMASLAPMEGDVEVVEGQYLGTPAFTFTNIPEDFNPEIRQDLAQSGDGLRYEFKGKALPSSLKVVTITAFDPLRFSWAFDPTGQRYHGLANVDDDIRFEMFDLFRSEFKGKPWPKIIICEYGAERAYWNVIAWYQARPDFSGIEIPASMSFLNDVTAVMDTCPTTSDVQL